MSPVQIDPEFRALIPPLSDDERQQLAENLRRDGCRDPLVVWNGLLLDGHHRFEICTTEQLAFHTVEQPCADRDDAKVWIIQHQFGRRNLNMAQRAELVMYLEPLLAAQARTRYLSTLKNVEVSSLGSIDSSEGKTLEQLAKVAGISEPSMRRAAAVYKRGTPELKDAMRSGKVKVSAAYDRLKAGEAIMPPSRKPPKPYTHKQTVRKESDVIPALSALLEEFRQKRKENNDDLEKRIWRPHGIKVFRQTEIANWLDNELVQLITRLQDLMPTASTTPAKHQSRRATSTGETHGHQKTQSTTH